MQSCYYEKSFFRHDPRRSSFLILITLFGGLFGITPQTRPHYLLHRDRAPDGHLSQLRVSIIRHPIVIILKQLQER